MKYATGGLNETLEVAQSYSNLSYHEGKILQKQVVNLERNYKNCASLVEIDDRWNNVFVKIDSREKDMVKESAMSQEKKNSLFHQVVFPITLST